MEVFRLSRAIHGRTLSGTGASKQGGRWNSTGTEIIYTSANRSLAMTEVVVHFAIGSLPDGFMMMTIQVPDTISIKEIDIRTLPAAWNQFPPLKTTQSIGDLFIREGKTCLLRVPSAVTTGDFNYLMNPVHPDFKKINISGYDPFPFDRRLFKE